MPDGAVQPLAEEKKKEIHEIYSYPFANRGQVLILFCYKDLEIERIDINTYSEEELSQNLTLALRPETSELVQTCIQAGLSLRMVTHDIRETAVGIALKAGILTQEKAEILENNPYVMDGKSFRTKLGGLKGDTSGTFFRYRINNHYAFEEIAANLKVLYEATAEDKLILAIGLQNLGRIVAVTGSGAGDALVLQKADVGYAMNLAGSDLAKKSAGIISLDDSLSSIIRSMVWGRNIYDCIMKYIQFLIPFIVSGLTTMAVGSVSFGKPIINPSQLLWAYFVSDTLSSLAFMTEQPGDETIKKTPYNRTPDFISTRMKKYIAGQSIYQSLVLILLVFRGDTFFKIISGREYVPWTEENGVHFTIVFTTFVFLQLFNQINSKISHPFHSELSGNLFNNNLFFKIQLIIFIFQLLIVQFGGRAFYCSPLNAYQYCVCFFIALGAFFVNFIVKLIPDSTYGKDIEFF